MIKHVLPTLCCMKMFDCLAGALAPRTLDTGIGTEPQILNTDTCRYIVHCDHFYEGVPRGTSFGLF